MIYDPERSRSSSRDVGISRRWTRGRAGTLPKIGVLGTPPPGDATYRALLQGLHELGYAEGQNLLLEFLGNPHRIPEFASELVRLTADVGSRP